ncbi:MAG: MarR family transcriptional regulator, partial [Myxococcales bacterium]
MTSVTRAGTDSPSWRAAVALGKLEHVRRIAQAASHFRTADSRLLWMFSDQQPRTLREIAEELRLEQSTVNRQANAAVKAGVLRRFRDEDQGAWQFLATDGAMARFTDDLDRHLGELDAASRAIPEGQR